MMNLESDGTLVEAHLQAVLVYEYNGHERTRLVGQESVGRVDAPDWLGEIQLAQLKSHVRATYSEV